MQSGLSKQPNMILKNLFTQPHKKSSIYSYVFDSLAKAKVVIFHEPQKFFFIYFVS